MSEKAPTELAKTEAGLPDLIPSLTDPTLPIGVRIMLDEGLFNRVNALAEMMSKAQGATPPHLLGKQGACFDVISQALTWRLAPGAVAKATYALPGGKLGYEGKLVQAIAESSGRMETQFEREYFGPWENVEGKFEVRNSRKTDDNGNPKKYVAASYTDKDEEGCGLTISCKMKNREKPDQFTFYLRQAYPRNSTLWATDPKTQLYYTAIRRFMSVVAPSLVMGVPFQDDVLPDELGPDMAKDVTPKGKPITNMDSLADHLATKTTPDPQDSHQEAGDDIVDADTGEVTEGSPEPPQAQHGQAHEQTGFLLDEIHVDMVKRGPKPTFPDMDTARRAMADRLDELVSDGVAGAIEQLCERNKTVIAQWDQDSQASWASAVNMALDDIAERAA